jgi:hypothetical protein
MGNNSTDKAEEIIINKEVLDYCLFEENVELKTPKIPKGKTLVIEDREFLTGEEISDMNELSYYICSFLVPGHNFRPDVVEVHYD